MPELINYFITALIAAVFGAITPVLIARYSKTKRERELDLASGYIKLVDMTSEQLEEKINQVTKLEERIALQKKEIEGLNARMTTMIMDEQKRDRERDKRENERNQAIADKIEGLENYIKTLIDTLRKHDIDIPPRPDVLKDDSTLNKIKAVR